MKTAVFFTAAMLLALSAAEAANASEIIDRNAQSVRLAVDASGRALTSYRVRGRAMHVLAWGAVDARQPTSGRPQVRSARTTRGGSGRRSGTSAVRTTARSSRSRSQHAPRPTARTGHCSRGGERSRTSTGARSAGGEPGSSISPTGRARSATRKRGPTGSTAAATTTCSGGSRTRASPCTASRRRVSAHRSTVTAGTSTSTRSTRATGRAGGGRTRSSRTARRGVFCLRLLPIQLTRPGNGAMYRLTAPGPGVTPDVSITIAGTARLQPEQLNGRCVRASSRTPCRTPSPEPTRSATFTDRAAPVVVPRKRVPSVRPRAGSTRRAARRPSKPRRPLA